MAVKTFTAGTPATASDANQFLANAGYVYVTQVTVGSGVASVNITSCFSSTYDNYLVSVAGLTNSTGGGAMLCKMLVGTTPTTSGFYGNTFYIANAAAGGLSNAQITNFPNFECGCLTNNGTNAFVFNVLSPNRVSRTFTTFSDVDDYYMRFGNCQYNGTTQFDGLQLYPSTGSMTGGTITVYGMRKA